MVTPLKHLLSMIDWTNPELYGRMQEILKGVKGGSHIEYIYAKLEEADKAIKQFIKTEALTGKTIRGIKTFQIRLVLNKYIQTVKEAETSVDIQFIAKAFEVEQLMEQAPDPKVIERLPTYFYVDNESFPSVFDLIKDYGKEPSWQANEGFNNDRGLVLHLGALHKLKEVLDELDSKEKLYRYQFIDIKDNLDRAMAQLLERLIKGKEYRDMLFIRALKDEEREPALYVVNHGTEENPDYKLEEFPSDRKKSRSIATKVVCRSIVDTRL